MHKSSCASPVGPSPLRRTILAQRRAVGWMLCECRRGKGHISLQGLDQPLGASVVDLKPLKSSVRLMAFSQSFVCWNRFFIFSCNVLSLIISMGYGAKREVGCETVLESRSRLSYPCMDIKILPHYSFLLLLSCLLIFLFFQ